MLIFGSREIDVKEYDRVSVVSERRSPIVIHNHQNFPINGWRLTHAIARTICSRHLDRREYWLDAVSSLLGLSNLIHSYRPNIRISSSRVSRLRDFSRTNRIGEISQGLVYAFLQRNGYPIINDFHFFCYQHGILIPAQTSTPDFVGQDAQMSNQLCLAESKGKETLSSGNLKSKLAKALSQCDSGEHILNGAGIPVAKKLGFCSEWSDENSSTYSTIHFVDPEENVPIEFGKFSSSHLHFASWFYLVGDFDNALRLLQGRGIELKNHYYRERLVNGKTYLTLDRLPETIWKLIDENSDIVSRRFLRYTLRVLYTEFTPGISLEIINFLESRDEKRSLELSYSDSTYNNYEGFADGTILIRPPMNYEY